MDSMVIVARQVTFRLETAWICNTPDRHILKKSNECDARTKPTILHVASGIYRGFRSSCSTYHLATSNDQRLADCPFFSHSKSYLIVFDINRDFGLLI